MINRVILVGRITKDPELIFVRGDVPLVKFTLAVNRNFTNASGVREADFIRCSVWNKQAENLAKYILKGALLGVEGSIRVNTFEKDNQKQFITEVNCEIIQFLESKKDNSKFNTNDNTENTNSQKNYNLNKQNKDHEETMFDEDDMPF
ncbi:single-stranded DNA-binding protein ['Camptotheca acuminata' phytoplasma]|uniref:single-stranded DNA-binding protein n=1 Tax='Camptotheca acuminata' phytoplasma TaxID=3239192 RepID=UPI00351A8A8E